MLGRAPASAIGPWRTFSSTAAVRLRKNKVRPAPTKAKLAARERKKALKSRKNAFESEKMPLTEAVNVLRVKILFRVQLTAVVDVQCTFRL